MMTKLMFNHSRAWTRISTPKTMAMSSSTSISSPFLQLLSAARGQPTCTSNSTSTLPLKPLPCFPLHADHIRIFSIPSTVPLSGIHKSHQNLSQLSSSPTEFHKHLCTLIKNANRRVKIATLYIGAANGCMTMSSGSKGTNLCNPPREEELLQSLSFHNDINKDKDVLEIKIVMDGSRALRPIRIVHDKNNTNTSSSTATYTTTSAKEVFYSLFPQNEEKIIMNPQNKEQQQQTNNKKGIALFNVHDKFMSSLPSPLNEVMGVFHLKVCIYCL